MDGTRSWSFSTTKRRSGCSPCSATGKDLMGAERHCMQESGHEGILPTRERRSRSLSRWIPRSPRKRGLKSDSLAGSSVSHSLARMMLRRRQSDGSPTSLRGHQTSVDGRNEAGVLNLGSSQTWVDEERAAFDKEAGLRDVHELRTRRLRISIPYAQQELVGELGVSSEHPRATPSSVRIDLTEEKDIAELPVGSRSAWVSSISSSTVDPTMILFGNDKGDPELQRLINVVEIEREIALRQLRRGSELLKARAAAERRELALTEAKQAWGDFTSLLNSQLGRIVCAVKRREDIEPDRCTARAIDTRKEVNSIPSLTVPGLLSSMDPESNTLTWPILTP